MKTLITFLILVGFTQTIFADTWGVGSIVQVWRNSNVLSENKPIKEYVVDLGMKEGITAGQVLSVYREIPILSPGSLGPWDSVKVFLGDLKVVSVSDRTSVARVNSIMDLRALPAVDYAMFLVGDTVELKSELPTP